MFLTGHDGADDRERDLVKENSPDINLKVFLEVDSNADLPVILEIDSKVESDLIFAIAIDM